MRVKALVSFCGVVSMQEGEVRDISDPSLCADLLQAHYIKAVEQTQKTEQRTTRKKKG